MASRLNANYNELEAVDKSLASLHAERHRLNMAISMLEIYAKRDAISVEVATEKLDEFTYI